MVVMLVAVGTASAATQTLTILGANGVQGDMDPYTEYSLDNGATWNQAFLSGAHPWGFLTGTNSWVNQSADNTVGIGVSTANTKTTLYRVRFNVPAGAINPTANIQIKADNAADVSLNGTLIASVTGNHGAVSSTADLVFASVVQTGLNEVTVAVTDWGGITGFNYRIDLTMDSARPLSVAPASSSPAGIAAASGNVSRTSWEMNRTGSWINIHGGPVFSAAVTPPVGDPGWVSAPNGETIDLFIPSIIPAPFCRVVVDYTYFQTVVTVPLNMNVLQFNLDFLGRLDDFLRVTVFNSAYPNGVVPPRTTLSYFNPTTGDFANYIVPGENRIVVTLADNCPQTNMVRGATVILNGQPISSINNNLPPVANAGAAQTAQCTGGSSANATLNGSASSDPDSDTLTYAWSWAGGSATGASPSASFPLGSTAVTLTVDDGNSHTATSTTTVTVQDTTPPTVNAGADVVLEATNPIGEAFNVMTQATATDTCCAVTPSVAPTDPYGLGSTSVNVSAVDCAGNSASDVMLVTVQDTTAPVLTVPVNVSIEANAVLSTVAIGSATATDIFPVTVTSNAPATYPLGITAITWTATDANGNTSTGTQNVTVVDTTAPTVTAQLIPLNISDEDEDEDAKGLFKVVFTAADIADPNPALTAVLNGATVSNGQIVKLEQDEDAGSEFDHGQLEVKGMNFTLTVTATDASGNVGTASAAYAFPVGHDDKKKQESKKEKSSNDKDGKNDDKDDKDD